MSPLTVEPFLSENGAFNTTCQHPTPSYTIPRSNSSYMYVQFSNTSHHAISSSDCLPSKTRVHYAYLIAGILSLISGHLIFLESCFNRGTTSRGAKAKEDHRNPRVLPRWLNGLVLALLAFINYLIAGILSLISGILIFLESCFNRGTTSRGAKAKEDHRNPGVLPRWLNGLVLALLAFINVFHCASAMVIIGDICVSERGWSKDSSAQLASVLWASVAVARWLGVVIIRFLAPTNLLFICNAVVTVTLAALWLSVVMDSDAGFTACIIVAAVGFGIIFPTGITFVENDIMKVTGVVTSVIMIAGDCQWMLNPLLLGNLMQEVSMRWYVYLSFIDQIICFSAFLALVVVVKVQVSRHDMDQESRDEGEGLRGKDSDRTGEGRDRELIAPYSGPPQSLYTHIRSHCDP